MATLQGDFANTQAAERAKSALQQAGIADTRIRKWNILEGGGSGQESGSAVATGAVLGGVLAGGAGLVAGQASGLLLMEDMKMVDIYPSRRESASSWISRATNKRSKRFFSPPVRPMCIMGRSPVKT